MTTKKIQNLSGKAALRSMTAVTNHQAKLRQLDAYAGRLTVSEAAKIAARTRQNILKAIYSGALPAIRGPKGNGWWILPADVSALFPPQVRETRRPWTRWSLEDRQRNGVMAKGDPGYEEAQERNRN